MIDSDLYRGLIRLHVLHHAAEHAVFGQWLIDELGHHGYRLSAGTLYPILHGLEEKGYLQSTIRAHEGRKRRMYRITPRGRKAFAAAKGKVLELFGELFEESSRR